MGAAAALIFLVGAVAVGYLYFTGGLNGLNFNLGGITSSNNGAQGSSSSGSDSGGSSTFIPTAPTPPAGFRTKSVRPVKPASKPKQVNKPKVGSTAPCAWYDIECQKQADLLDTSGH